jgi:protein LTV1
LDEFQKSISINKYQVENRKKNDINNNEKEDASDDDTLTGDSDSDQTIETDSQAEEEEDEANELIKIKSKYQHEDRFDCESIVSTYSTLYNHPKLITEQQNNNKIKLSRKTGLPLGVLPEKDKPLKYLEKMDHKITRILPDIPKREKDETKEEKKERKRLVKEHRRERRIEKKINQEAFKDEKALQVKMRTKNLETQSHLIKLPL